MLQQHLKEVRSMNNAPIWVQVLCSAVHKTGHFGEVLPSQSLGQYWRNICCKHCGGGDPKPLSKYEVSNYTKQMRKQDKTANGFSNKVMKAELAGGPKHGGITTAKHAPKLLLEPGSLSIVSMLLLAKKPKNPIWAIFVWAGSFWWIDFNQIGTDKTEKLAFKILLWILKIHITVIKHTRSDCAILMLHFDAWPWLT